MKIVPNWLEGKKYFSATTDINYRINNIVKPTNYFKYKLSSLDFTSYIPAKESPAAELK